MFCSKSLFGLQSTAGSVSILLVCAVLFFLSGSALAQKRSGKVKLQDVDKKGDAFRFGKGIVHSRRDRHWDIMLDLPQGMGSNNKKLSRRFRKGGIAKVGMRPLSLLKNPRTARYKPALKPSEILPGYSYYVRLADGRRYGKIRIIRFSQALKTVEFRWQLF